MARIALWVLLVMGATGCRCIVEPDVSFWACNSQGQCEAGLTCCLDALCHENCDSVCVPGCDAQSTCLLGVCRPNDCPDTDCADRQVCLDGRCHDKACVGVVCAADAVCALGGCRPRQCGAEVCDAGLSCSDAGQCEDFACDGVSCMAGLHCDVGRCLTAP